MFNVFAENARGFGEKGLGFFYGASVLNDL